MLYRVIAASLTFLVACSEDTPSPDAGQTRLDSTPSMGSDSGNTGPEDAMVSPDATAPIDGGMIADSGAAADAAAPEDAAVIQDASSPEDAAVSMDAATTADAGTPTGPCMMDSDCGPGGWCRPTMAGGNACAPWQSEGGSCGGLVQPWSRERCEPNLSCVNRHPLLVDAPGICAVPVTLQELDSMGRQYDGRVVAVQGRSTMGQDFFGFVSYTIAACTRRGCPTTNPCCNDCSASQIVATSSTTRMGADLYSPMNMVYTCSGNECTDPANNRKLWSDSCDLTPGKYRLIGTYRYGPPATFEAAVEPGMYP